MAKKKKEAGESLRLLDKPRILYPEPGTASQSVFFGVLLFLGSAGAWGSLFGAFEVPVDPVPAALAGGISLLFSLLLFSWKRQHWVLSFLGIALWVGLVIFHFSDLVQGCAHTVNRILEAYSDRLGITLPYLITDALSPQEIRSQCTVFFCLLAFPFSFFLSFFLVGRRSGLSAFLLTGALLLIPMLISLEPPAIYLAALLLFWLAILILTPSLGKRHRLLEERGRFHASGGVAARPFMLWLLPAAALCMIATYLLVPAETYQRPQVAADLWEGITNGFGWNAALDGGVGNGNGRVNLSGLGDRNYTGETMLRVRYEWEHADGASGTAGNLQKDYLKSFVGSVYTGHSWERLSPQDQAELEERVGNLRSPNLLDTISRNFSQETGASYRLSVENVGANPRCVYIPYGLRSAGENLESQNLRYTGDGFLESTRFFSGTPSYELSAWGIPTTFQSYASRFQDAVLMEYFSQEPSSGSLTLQELMSLLNGQWLDSFWESSNVLQSLDLWKAPQEALDLLTPQQQETARSLEAYNEFVYEHYTQLPDGLRDSLEQYLRDNILGGAAAGEGSATLDVSTLTQQVANTLAAQCTYTLAPPPVPEEEDFVEYFLFQSRQGFCVHFATAAVALFRAAGLPARYAEGYAVPAGEEGWVDVPDYNAHAWVEIYLGGTGWIPVEVTPAGPDAPAATEDALPIEAAPSPTPEPTPSPTPSSPSSPTPERTPSPAPVQTQVPAPSPEGTGGPPQPGRGASHGTILWWFAGIAGTIVLLAGAMLLRRRIVLTSRRRRFAQRNHNLGALALYQHLLRLDEEAAAHLPNWDRPLPPALEKLALKARFSQHSLTKEELEPLYQEIRKLSLQLQKDLPVFRRLWCQYGPVLF